MNIKEYREKRNLSREEMAVLLGVSFSSIHRWESGKSKPSALAIKRFEEIMRRENG